MWPAPIGWWRRVSPAIYITRAQDLGSVVVDSLLACLAFGSVGEHTFLYWQYSTHQAAAPTERETSSRVCAPPLHSIPCTALESAQPRPEVWRTRWCAIPAYRVYRVWNKYISRTWTAIVFVLFLELGPRVHWSRDKLWASALRSMGDHSRESGRSKNQTQREGSYLPRSHWK